MVCVSTFYDAHETKKTPNDHFLGDVSSPSSDTGLEFQRLNKAFIFFLNTNNQSKNHITAKHDAASLALR